MIQMIHFFDGNGKKLVHVLEKFYVPKYLLESNSGCFKSRQCTVAIR